MFMAFSLFDIYFFASGVFGAFPAHQGDVVFPHPGR
jgi:hypothetical protein